jgi:hypothetical protein
MWTLCDTLFHLSSPGSGRNGAYDFCTGPVRFRLPSCFLLNRGIWIDDSAAVRFFLPID